MAALLAAGLVVGACSDDPSVDDFCRAAEATRAAGPLFPDRTDGEPVPEPLALEALEDLADTSPDEIAAQVDVLVREARALVAEADARLDAATSTSGTSTPPAPVERPTRDEVDAAQREVASYARAECDLDLNRP